MQACQLKAGEVVYYAENIYGDEYAKGAIWQAMTISLFFHLFFSLQKLKNLEVTNSKSMWEPMACAEEV